MGITLFHIGETEIRLHMLTVPVIFISICMGMINELAVTLIALSLHEYCHVLAAKAKGVSVLNIDIVPCGFSARFSSSKQTLSDTIFICSAGVIFSILSGICIVGLCTVLKTDAELAMHFAYISIVLGTMNILPVMPLDGGRMLYCALCSRMYEKKARLLSILIGLAVSCTCILLSIVGIMRKQLNFTALILSSLMAAGTLTQIKRKECGVGSALILAASAGQGKRLPVSLHAFGENADISEVRYAMESKKYNMIAAVDDNLHVVGILDEGDIFSAVCEGCETLREAIALHENISSQVKLTVDN